MIVEIVYLLEKVVRRKDQSMDAVVVIDIVAVFPVLARRQPEENVVARTYSFLYEETHTFSMDGKIELNIEINTKWREDGVTKINL